MKTLRRSDSSKWLEQSHLTKNGSQDSDIKYRMLGRLHGWYHIMTQTACSVLSLHNFPLTEFVMNLRTPSDSILAAMDRVELVGSLLRHDAWFPFGTFLRKVLFQTFQTWPNKQNAKTIQNDQTNESTSLVTLSSLAEKMCSTHRCILVSSKI